jgi:tetratricopeptide (TPR) repeat protein
VACDLSRKAISYLLSALNYMAPKNSSLEQKESAIRGVLRRYPFWTDGQLSLANIALQADNLALAYSSAISAKILSGRDKVRSRQSLFLLGRCFLKRSDWQAALNYFKEAETLGLDSSSLKEDTAAAYILGERYAEALKLLEAIPDSEISPEAKAALRFVRGVQGFADEINIRLDKL